ncbi:hypothetical protein OAM83_03180 [Candidatus Pelagibacter sp.]|jgi:O-antigen/teichoic acid export membrane protein|nr:hypothetical protein [Candidatus Pelagibacter sp.]|tara:strand:- start:1121 stop:1342 length:222 start_codon:yes stop_codon:yes gene_type:complete
MSKFFIISFIFVLFYQVNAYAYLDPGTGSIILQALAGAVAAISSFFYYYGKKIKDFFKRFKKVIREDNKKDSD